MTDPDKATEIARLLQIVENKTFQLAQLRKKGTSKSKKVRQYRLYKTILLATQIAATVAQGWTLQSQPIKK